MTAKRIAVAGVGEAVGRTATAVNLAVELANGGWNVLLSDLDPEASATRALGLEPARDPWREPPAAVEVANGTFEVMRGGRGLAGATAPDVRRLVDGDGSHDLIVMDTPSEITTIPAAAVERAHVLLVPVQPGTDVVKDVRAAAQLLTLVGSRGSRLRAVLVRSRDAQLAEQARAELESAYPGTAYQTVIPEDDAIDYALHTGVPLAGQAPDSRAAAAYRMLAIEVASDLDAAGEPGE